MKSTILTARQQAELDKAIIQYLTPIAPPELLSQLTPLLTTNDDEIVDQYLEKKWATVLRLQKKILDLEHEVSNLRSAIDMSNANAVVLGQDRINWLPKVVKTTYLTNNVLVTSVKIHPVLGNVYCGCSDGSVYVWSLATGDMIPDKIIRGHSRNINSLAFSNEVVLGKSYVFATCSSDLSIKIWDSGSYKHIRTLTGHDHTVSAVAFSHSDSNILYSVSRDKSVKIWDLTQGNCIKTFIGHSEWVRDIDVSQVSQHGDFILTCSNDQSTRLSHASSGTGLCLIVGHTHVVETCKFLPSLSNFLLDKYITKNEDLFPSIPQELVNDPIYKVLGYKYCITGSRDNTIKVWLLPPPVIVPHRHPLPSKYNNSQAWLVAQFAGHSSWVKSLCIHPNGRFVFSGSDDKTVKIWDLSRLNNPEVGSLMGHDGFINSIDFAQLTKVEAVQNGKTEKEEEEEEEEDEEAVYDNLLKDVQSRMRCIFVTGAVDNSVRVWS
ncbi:uncharacterized protein SPAPADRAFT_67304 [Spathaspora passalidarum NRRL Y-27907]|uniref:Nuclear distribution protein PAC1 n=1 Tax=Spathaspora passalidarum (strain NRRL Y-27907 / 11-Y1) TaxID=619300 RepID=G3AR48_SPAPN|nr:uncharacterized protein SPAPADRAFT_67304 [Spathaspora passalidarum NRRL Y-27907]EGW31222.1 hypothetical protein SPAPADRAFT_67304 [Spathaspora passalidarum NRRL Y-27907]